MIRNGFRASPADYPGPLMADPRTIGKWVGGEVDTGQAPAEPSVNDPPVVRIPTLLP
jgi:hypothetical protein